MQEYKREQRLSSVLSLDNTWIRVVKFTRRPLYPQERTHLSTEVEAGWASDATSIFWRWQKFLAMPRMINSMQRLGYALAVSEFNAHSNKWTYAFKYTSLNIHNAVCMLHPLLHAVIFPVFPMNFTKWGTFLNAACSAGKYQLWIAHISTHNIYDNRLKHLPHVLSLNEGMLALYTEWFRKMEPIEQ